MGASSPWRAICPCRGHCAGAAWSTGAVRGISSSSASPNRPGPASAGVAGRRLPGRRRIILARAARTRASLAEHSKRLLPALMCRAPAAIPPRFSHTAGGCVGRVAPPLLVRRGFSAKVVGRTRPEGHSATLGAVRRDACAPCLFACRFSQALGRTAAEGHAPLCRAVPRDARRPRVYSPRFRPKPWGARRPWATQPRSRRCVGTRGATVLIRLPFCQAWAHGVPGARSHARGRASGRVAPVPIRPRFGQALGARVQAQGVQAPRPVMAAPPVCRRSVPGVGPLARRERAPKWGEERLEVETSTVSRR